MCPCMDFLDFNKAIFDVESANEWLIAASHLDYNTIDVYGNNLIHVFCRLGCYSLMETVLKSNHIGIDHQNSVGDTPLHIAVRFGQENLVSLVFYCLFQLFSYGANANVVNISGNTPLHVAFFFKHKSIAKVSAFY